MSADDEIRVDAMPAYATGTLDYDRIPQMLGETFADLDDDLHAAAIDNELRWTAQVPDGVGYYSITVMFAPTGEVVGTTRIHWSRLLP